MSVGCANLELPKKKVDTMSDLMTTFALSNAVNESINDQSVRLLGGLLLSVRDEISDEEFAKALYEFSANLVATTAELVTKVFLTEEQVASMLAEAQELKDNAESGL